MRVTGRRTSKRQPRKSGVSCVGDIGGLFKFLVKLGRRRKGFFVRGFYLDGDWVLKLRLGGIVPLSTIDYIGHAAMVIFMGGCNFRCPYCYNSHMLNPIDCEQRDVKEIEATIKGARELISGVVFSGGEPTCQPEQLLRLAKFAKSIGLKVKLDTNGSAPGVVERMLEEGIVNHVAVDVKAPFELGKYARAAGIPEVRKAIASLRRTMELCFGRVTLEARTTFLTELLTEEDIRRIAKSIKCDIYALQQFQPKLTVVDPDLREVAPPSRELMLKLGRVAKEAGLADVRVRTVEGGEEKIF